MYGQLWLICLSGSQCDELKIYWWVSKWRNRWATNFVSLHSTSVCKSRLAMQNNDRVEFSNILSEYNNERYLKSLLIQIGFQIVLVLSPQTSSQSVENECDTLYVMKGVEKHYSLINLKFVFRGIWYPLFYSHGLKSGNKENYYL